MPTGLPKETVLLPAQSGQRLDAALVVLFPDLGVRARRRLWDWCRIIVDGRPRPPGFVVQQGQVVRVEQAEAARYESARPEAGPAQAEHTLLPRLVAASPDYLAFAKPAGLHAAHIRGGMGESLEKLVFERWQEMSGSWRASKAAEPQEQLPEILCGQTCIFLTRLDRGTSGLVLAARSEDAAARFRQWEEAGEVLKSYYAIVTGALAESLTLDRELLTADRQVTKVLEAQAGATRTTTATPFGPVRLASQAEAPAEQTLEQTLVRVQIQRGARHQIRAHLAFAGYPLWGDVLYGGPATANGMFYLHHAVVALPGFQAEAPLPPWPRGVFCSTSRQ